MKHLFLMILFIFIPLLGSAQESLYSGENDPETKQEFNEKLPLFFQNKTEAHSKHCFFKPLKFKNKMNGICKAFLEHALLIGIYDQGSDGRWIRKEVLRLPSWNEDATFDFFDLIGDGRFFLKVISDGNRGSNEYQAILTYIGWHEGKFVPVLMETFSYDSEGSSWELHYKAAFTFEKVQTDKVAVRVDVHYKIHEEKFDPKKDTEPVIKDEFEHWPDNLRWNEKNYSFYDNEFEKNKLEHSKYKQQKEIEEMRLKFLEKRPDLSHLDYPDLDKLGIMM